MLKFEKKMNIAVNESMITQTMEPASISASGFNTFHSNYFFNYDDAFYQFLLLCAIDICIPKRIECKYPLPVQYLCLWLHYHQNLVSLVYVSCFTVNNNHFRVKETAAWQQEIRTDLKTQM